MSKQIQEVRGGINEKALISAIGHLFNNSFVALAELMQNARRAQATSVRIEVDRKAKSIAIVDDGEGVDDFSKAIVVAESGWKERVKLSENPFGMGLMASFAISESVTVRSKGLIMKANLDDIACKRLLTALIDPEPVTYGAVILLEGVNDTLFEIKMETDWSVAGGKASSDVLHKKLAQFAKGFAIPVFYNGQELPRAHALTALKGEQTPIGFVQISGVHIPRARIGNSSIAQPFSVSRPNVSGYLQGLPIFGGHVNHCERDVVHLDSLTFAPRMPDRTQLFDEELQLRRVKNIFDGIVHRFLAQEKARLDPLAFATAYWEDCVAYGMHAMLNDVPWVPCSLLNLVASVTAESLEIWTAFSSASATEGFISKEALKSEGTKLLFDAPDSVHDNAAAPMILKVMQELGWATVNDGAFHENHWLRKELIDANDLVIAVTAIDAGESRKIWLNGCDDTCNLSLVGEIELKVTSKTDPEFNIAHVMRDDWIAVPSNQDLVALDVYFPKTFIKSPDHPVTALNDFQDENSFKRDDWETDALDDFDAEVSALRGDSLASLVGRKIQAMNLLLTDSNLSQVVALHPVRRWDEREGQYHDPVIGSVDLGDSRFWQRMREAIAGSGAVDAETLKDAFKRAISFGQYLDGPLAKAQADTVDAQLALSE